MLEDAKWLSRQGECECQYWALLRQKGISCIPEVINLYIGKKELENFYVLLFLDKLKLYLSKHLRNGTFGIWEGDSYVALSLFLLSSK